MNQVLGVLTWHPTASELSYWHTPRDHSGAVAMPGTQNATVTLHA
ncbi:hypothetical protein ACWDZ4_07285 [Streptomyces sp. NPDC003016]